MKALFPIILFVLLLLSCHDSITVLKGCCEKPPVDQKIGTSGKVFVPNVFTPNNDGVHDRMVVYSDSMIRIKNLEIRNKDNVIVYFITNLALTEYTSTWDGTFNGRIERGVYSYKMIVESIDNYVISIEGEICNCPCDQEVDKDILPIRNCGFGICDPLWIDCVSNEHLSCFGY